MARYGPNRMWMYCTYALSALAGMVFSVTAATATASAYAHDFDFTDTSPRRPAIAFCIDYDMVHDFAVSAMKFAELVAAVQPSFRMEETPREGRALHDVAFNIADQPGQAWRSAADCYRHIDPGRLQL